MSRTSLGATPFGVGNVLDNALTGNESPNTLLAGVGNDTLDGGAGNDVLWGQAGADTFVLRGGTGIDRVADFQPGIDRLRLVDVAPMAFADILAATVETGASCGIDLGDGDRLVLANVAKATLSAADFLFG